MVSTNLSAGSPVLIHKMRRAVEVGLYPSLEKFYRVVEGNSHSRASSIAMIPPAHKRTGGLGTTTYGEWCYTIGLFQGLIQNWLPQGDRRRILDIGCGVGRQFISMFPLMGPEDSYTGLDISESFIQICKENFRDKRATFVHSAASNDFYAKNNAGPKEWPFSADSFDFMVAVSVWTHLAPLDFRFYLKEVATKLAPGGRAMITFFLLDDIYFDTLPARTDEMSLYYPQPRSYWRFTEQVNGDKDFYSPSWVSVPEVAIGVTQVEFDRLLAEFGLRTVAKMVGSWKDRPGTYFQDIVVLERA